jgi:hypothetical protein
MPSCIKVTFQFILDDPMARDRLLAMVKRSCRLRYMTEWSEDYVAVIGPFKTQILI